ncbi:ABC-three component system middle component 6 [Malaciobacter marinus]|jgi:hypothetical protein|uniref:ABC-three component system middle component 6 n=1 Tax=Malaciobacter marinus TaxID=505249 RepID=UPI0009A65867|nr:ABC-three component system middle component 6 [Malaciobacter marinus]SKB28853.1 hypothetical protein SAMN06295997_103130 [Malaciobacter marinus]
MIVSKDINPERDFYYLGAKTIKVLASINDKDIDFFKVYSELNKSENISINLFALTLDWLYLIGAIDKPRKGNIVKCF